MGLRRAAIIVLAVAAASAPTVWAAPQVDIKAHTRLALIKARARDNGMVDITGQLVDKLTGDGVASQTVDVAVAGQTVPARTGPDGTFEAIVAAAPGPISVALTYKGSRELDPADPLTVETDPAKQQVVLAIAKLADTPAGAKLLVTAMSDRGLVAVPLALSIAAEASDVSRPLRAVAAHEPFELTRKDAGGPGIYRVRAAFVGDGQTQSAAREVLVELIAETTTSMLLSKQKLAFEDDLTATGVVLDADGRGVDGAAVTLISGDRRLAQGATDAAGHYKLKVEAEVIAPQNEHEVGVQVQADPGKSFIRPSHSQPVMLRIADPQPVPVSWTVAAFVATLLAAGAFFVARTKPWLRFRRRQQPPAETSAEPNADDNIAGGLVAARPGIVSTLRRAADDTFSGVVRDTVRGRPIAGASVKLLVQASAGDTVRELAQTTAADGAFAFEGLVAGEWAASVAADGHVTERFAVTIPHRGELRGVRVDLVPVRERVFQLYRRVAEPILPEPRLWGVWSPRQIVDHVRAKLPSPALGELTDFVEEVYFSPRLVAETVLATATERVDRAIDERAPRPAN